MSVLYPHEHFSCYNYDKGKNAKLEILQISKGKTIEKNLYDIDIVFVIKGKFTLSYAKIIDREIEVGKIIIFPPGSQIKIHAIEDVYFIICRARGIVQLCECFPLKYLYNQKNEQYQEKFYTLEIHNRINKFLEFMIECVNDGLKCTYYYETKMKELLFLLRAYYSKEELALFFSPILSHNFSFMNLMYQNYRNVKNIQELADLSMYSESGFKKQFTKVFGTSASEWLRDQKASLIFHDLNCTDLSIKELADKYNFSSVSSFTVFCQSKFGLPPGQIRSNKQSNNTP